MDITLKPCPFCGGEANVFARSGAIVVCKKCGARTREVEDVDTMCLDGTVTSYAINEVVEAWNRRSE